MLARVFCTEMTPTFPTDQCFAGSGLLHVVGHGGRRGPLHVAGERMKVAPHYVEMIGHGKTSPAQKDIFGTVSLAEEMSSTDTPEFPTGASPIV